MVDVRQWLDSLGLDQYAEAFDENAIRWEQLPKLDHDILKDIGVKAAGHRMKLLEAAAGFSDVETAPSSDPPKHAIPPAIAGSTGEVERRQLSVMFCDLVGSVEFGERMDVEDYRDLLARFRNAVVGAVERYDGFVARHQGDGLLVYFGYPQAHEDDVERAVRAGLEVVRAIEDLDHPFAVSPKVRVGIATGLAIVGDVLSTSASDRAELAVLGPTPNLAARLQSEAKPNSVVISETTRALTAGLFDIESLPVRKLKGISDAVTPHRVRSEVLGQSRFVARSGTHLSPFVGREEELELLARRWSRVKHAQGQVALVVGESGIGKSRLLQQLREYVESEPCEFISIQCSPYHENSAFHPVIANFERALQFAKTRDSSAQLDRLREHLTELGRTSEQVLGAFVHLLSIPTEDRFPIVDTMDTAQRREHILEGLVDYFWRRAERAPVLCAFEDMHWSDPSTRELLGRMVGAIGSQNVLLFVTTRPVFEAEWKDLPYAQVFSLSRLDLQEGKQLAQAVASTTATTLSIEALDDIVSRAGGNPLFIEELTRTAGHSQQRFSYDRMIPVTLRDSLMARLDTSELGKAVAQCASVIGRTFEARVLADVWDGTQSLLTEGLNELADLSVLTRQGEGHLTQYAFRHALMRDTAYETLLRKHRSNLHIRVVEALEKRHPESSSKQPELLARHYSEGGVPQRAAELWLAAARLSLSRSANIETIAHVKAAQASLDSIPASDERDALELNLLIAIGPALMSTSGSASKEVQQTYTRALDLSNRIGDLEQKFNATWGLWLHHQSGGEHEAARSRAGEIVKIGRQIPDSTYLLQGHHAMWTTESHVGNDAKALRHAEQGTSLYNMEQHRQSISLYGDHDAGVCGNIHIAFHRWALGYPDQAVIAVRDSLTLAEALQHPPSTVVAQFYAAMIYQLLGEPKRVLEFTERVVESSIEHGMSAWELNGEILRGWALGTQGDSDGLEIMGTRLKVRKATTSRMRQAYYLTLFSDLLGRTGQSSTALEVISEAHSMLDETGERRWEPFVHVVHGDALRIVGDDDQAERHYQLGLEIARRRGARSFQLMGTVRLARLLRDQGNSKDARELLAPVYAQFTKGFDTPDLREAKALLDDLT
ncbi:AAA family ATPase [Gammaproteobacteria bacterium]|nr:AAA family ATPase [Gammaproteobacteria bacterium]